MVDRTTALAAVGDPRTPPAMLADIAQTYPDLWVAVAQHPNTYPDLLNWLAGRGNPQVAAAVQAAQARRAAVVPTPPAYPVAAYPPGYPGAPGYPGTPYVMPGHPAYPYHAGKSGVAKALDSMTGLEGDAIVTFRGLFRDTFKKHSRADMDALMYAGTEAATWDRQWRLPWLYARVFAVLLSAYLLLWACMLIFKDSSGNVIPGVIFTGALVMPATTMVFFWEFNQAKNVSFFDVVRIFFIGGALSILLTFVVSAVTDMMHSSGSYGIGGAFVEASFIGFTEELAKVIVVFVFVRKLYGCLISNGLLVGAIVGTGFAVFETMGYGTSGWMNGGMEWILLIRGVLSVGGHVVWAAISGAAIMLAQRQGSAQVNLATMHWGKFLALFAVPFVLHMLWDFFGFTVGALVFYAFAFGLIAIAWVFIVRLINSGLRQYAALLSR